MVQASLPCPPRLRYAVPFLYGAFQMNRTVWAIGVLCFVAASLILIFAASAPDDSPKARLERIRDECDRTYGKGTNQSFNCSMTLMKRFAIEQQTDALDRAYQRAR